MEIETIRKDIEDKYKACAEAGAQFNKALYELRGINFSVNQEDKDEVKKAMELGRDIDMRTAYLLKTLLVQHGNVLFL